jgi:hypothetical protein
MPPVNFTTTLSKDGGWSFIFFHRSLLGDRGPKGIKGTRVRGTINGKPFKATAQPWKNDECVITMSAALRKQVGVEAGETVTVTLEPDDAPPPTWEPPGDLAAALRSAKGGRAAWEKMAPSYRRYYVEWVIGAKREETRAGRVQQAVEKVLAGENPFRSRCSHRSIPSAALSYSALVVWRAVPGRLRRRTIAAAPP